MSAKKNVHVPLRYDKIKTKKVGKKEDISKRKEIKLEVTNGNECYEHYCASTVATQ